MNNSNNNNQEFARLQGNVSNNQDLDNKDLDNQDLDNKNLDNQDTDSWEEIVSVLQDIITPDQRENILSVLNPLLSELEGILLNVDPTLIQNLVFTAWRYVYSSCSNLCSYI